jgi:hypothetical protein
VGLTLTALNPFWLRAELRRGIRFPIHVVAAPQRAESCQEIIGGDVYSDGTRPNCVTRGYLAKTPR